MADLQRMRDGADGCRGAGGLKGNPEAVREQCGKPLVRPCVLREERLPAGRVVFTHTDPAPAQAVDDAVSKPPLPPGPWAYLVLGEEPAIKEELFPERDHLANW